LALASALNSALNSALASKDRAFQTSKSRFLLDRRPRAQGEACARGAIRVKMA
jgi:hypothetical protein